MRGAFVIVTVVFYIYGVYGNTVVPVNNPTSDESFRQGMATATIPQRLPTRQPMVGSRTASPRTKAPSKPVRVNGRALIPFNNEETFTPPRTQLPMIIGFPVFRTRILAPVTLPPRIVETISTSTTTVKRKNRQDVAATAIIPTTLTIPTTTIKRTTSPTMRTIVTTTTEPRTEPMVIGFPVFRTRFLIPSTPPEPPVTTTTEPRTEPMVIGFPVFRTRFLIPSTPPEPPVTVKIVAPLTTSTQVTENNIKHVVEGDQTTINLPNPTSVDQKLNFTIFQTNRSEMTSQPATEPLSETITTSSTTVKSKNGQDVVAKAIMPTTLTIPTTINSTRVTGNAVERDQTTISIPNPTTVDQKPNFTIFPTNKSEMTSQPATEPPAQNSSSYVSTSGGLTKNGAPAARNGSNINNLNATNGPPSVIALCGYPPYNDPMACIILDYFFEPISTCEHEWGRILFSVLVGIVATAIISVNGLIIVIILKNPDMRTHYDSIKVSLAIADAIIGFLLFVTVLPNSIWIRGLSEADIVDAIKDDVNSPAAIVVGSLLSLTMQASMLHLCFLSIERFLSIKISFWLLRRKTSSITITLIALWIASLMSAFLPAALPQHFEYKFQPAVLIHMLTIKPKAGTFTQVGHESLIYVMITMVLPYIVMVTFCIWTGVVSYGKLTSSKKYFGKGRSTSSAESSNTHSKSISGSFSPAREKNKQNLKPEISVFVTILIMISAFTLTLMPFALVVGLFVGGQLNCDNYTIPYVITFYFGLLNSLANGIIYSVRDARFRSAVKRIVSCEDIRNMTKSFSTHTYTNSRV